MNTNKLPCNTLSPSLSTKWNFQFCILISCFISILINSDLAKSESGGTLFRKAHGDFFHLYSAERTDLRAGYIYEPGAKEKSGPGEFDLHNYYTEFTLLSPLGEDSFFSIGGDFSVRRYLFSIVDSAPTRIGSENLYKFTFRPGWGIFLTDDVLVWGEADIGLYSDLERGLANRDDYRILGSAQIIFRLNPGAALLAGVSYSNTYLDQVTLPFIGLRMLSESGQTHISIDFPFHARLGYYFNPQLETFAQFTVSGDRYRTEIEGREFDIGIHDQRAGLGARFWLGSYLSLTFEGGRTVGSELRFMTPNPGQFLEADISPHWYVQSYMGLAF
ncbi:MAG TPA: DUF6268 family outer membrane beta-barrel protein [Oligoflexia bacterium]|nr:DUF6268 family outer membrane beta-barrel protein [Oligoflexia bacterium]HMP47844.1 DUF6268 family outer membrane beta-barrel protein [Oligoflexia bacterium]